jgi:hypothetical protein
VRREATLVPRFHGGPYGPGDVVEGVILAREAERSRTLNAYLRYVDRSRSFSGAAAGAALEMGLACQAFSVVETKKPGDDSYRRSTNYIDIFDEWPPLDPSLPEQSFTVRVPADAPFSYDGRALGFLWMAIAREKRRWFQSDAGRIAYLQVMP